MLWARSSENWARARSWCAPVFLRFPVSIRLPAFNSVCWPLAASDSSTDVASRCNTAVARSAAPIATLHGGWLTHLLSPSFSVSTSASRSVPRFECALLFLASTLRLILRIGDLHVLHLRSILPSFAGVCCVSCDAII